MINQTKFASFRYHEDVPANRKTRLLALDVVVADLAQKCLEITSEILPGIDDLLCKACNRIGVERKKVTAFVLESNELQASCINCSGETCVLQVSSGLINLLEPDELCFVLGHELGHFSLGHVVEKGSDESAGEEMFMSRAAEISADRYGLMACESLDVSLRAVMKTLSGLDSKFIRFDVAKFIKALNRSETISGSGGHLSHPSLVVRARALIWFSLIFQASAHQETEQEIGKINMRVSRDLHRFVDGRFREHVGSLKESFYKWKVVQLIHETPVAIDLWGRKVEVEFGALTLVEFKEFLCDDFFIVSKDIENRLSVLKEQIVTEHPRTSKQIIDESTERAYNLFGLLD